MKKWEKDDDLIILKYSPHLTIEELRDKYFPKKTIKSVRHRVTRLGCEFIRNERFWTKKEEDILKEFIKNRETSITKISKHLPNRSKETIHRRLKNSYNYKIPRTEFEDLKIIPWSEEEIEILKEWYPILGVRFSNSRKIIGTQNIMDLLPNYRTKESVIIKSNKMGLTLNPQINVPKGKVRCILCLEIKKLDEFYINNGKTIYGRCKNCISIVSRKQRRESEDKRLSYTLYSRFGHIKGVTINKCRNLVRDLIKKDGYRCFFEDEFCGDRHVEGLTIGHKKSISQSGKPLELDNVFFLCMEHNTTMMDISFEELKKSLKSISKSIENNFISTQP